MGDCIERDKIGLTDFEYDELVKSLRDPVHSLDCEFCDRKCCYPEGRSDNKCVIIQAADAIEELEQENERLHAADVRPVVRGEWIRNGWSIRCSECGYDMPFSVRNYCPNCGADMRTGAE
jgi:hypothetical protein